MTALWVRFRSLCLALVVVACGGVEEGSVGDTSTMQDQAKLVLSQLEAARFLGTATYGPTEAEITALAESGFEPWFTAQFNQPLTSHLAYLDEERINRAPDLVQVAQTQESFWAQAVTAPDVLRQRVVFALSEIFVISAESSALGNQPWAIASYFDMLARNAFGNFRTLLEDVSLHPAMGSYLSHLKNEKESTKVVGGQTVTRLPDENYAREVMQLFAIGLWELNLDGSQRKDGNGQPIPTYDQDDILGMARVFTGFSWNHCDVTKDSCFRSGPNNATLFPNYENWRLPLRAFERFHEPGQKRIIRGKVIAAGGTALADLSEALDTLFTHPNVGPFIGKQLIQRLVTSNPSPAYVRRVANAFGNNGQGVRGDLRAVIRAVLLDPEARDLAARTTTSFGKLREPVVRYGQFLRAFNARATSTYYRIPNLTNPVTYLGQSPFRSPSVFNFFRPDYAPRNILAQSLVAPEFQILHETTVIGNTNFFDSAIRTVVNPNRPDLIVPDYSAFVGDAVNPTRLLERLNLLLTANALSPTAQSTILQALNAMPAGTDAQKLNRTRSAVLLVLASPDYLIQK